MPEIAELIPYIESPKARANLLPKKSEIIPPIVAPRLAPKTWEVINNIKEETEK